MNGEGSIVQRIHQELEKGVEARPAVQLTKATALAESQLKVQNDKRKEKRKKERKEEKERNRAEKGLMYSQIARNVKPVCPS